MARYFITAFALLALVAAVCRFSCCCLLLFLTQKKFTSSLLLTLFLFLIFASTAAESGMCSWYGPGFAGHKTANGERFDPDHQLTAAHKTLPFGTHVKVTIGAKSLVVRINDRGPFAPGRILDVSTKAAIELGLKTKGVAHCTIAKV